LLWVVKKKITIIFHLFIRSLKETYKHNYFAPTRKFLFVYIMIYDYLFYINPKLGFK